MFLIASMSRAQNYICQINRSNYRFLPILMIASLAVLLLTGFPVVLILVGLALINDFLVMLVDLFFLDFPFHATNLGLRIVEPVSRCSANLRLYGRDAGTVWCCQ